MKRANLTLGAIALMALLLGCIPFNPTARPAPTPTEVVQAESPVPTATPLPTETSTPLPPEPSPTPTLVPTLTAPPPTATPATSEALLAVMDEIEAEVSALRGLEETSPISRTFMTRQELADYMAQELEEEYPPEEVEADVRVLAAFDFVPEDYDLLGLMVSLYSSQVVGFYDDEVDTLYVVTDNAAGEELDILARVTFAHEYTHGLQDKHFDLDTFVDDAKFNDDQLLAHLSLVEGDASLAMTEYLIAHLFELTDEEIAQLMEGGDPADEAILEAAPAIIRETFIFPYVSGLEFVSALQEDGWDAVDAAFADPPQSTEQILHPEKYLSRDEPTVVTLPPLTDTLGAGWRLVEAETLGEFQTTLYLEQQVDEATSTLATEGWDGDQYAVYINGADEVLVFATVWDSPEDGQEFVDAYAAYAEGKYGQPASEEGQNELWWETEDQVAVLTWEETTALVILGPNRPLVERVLAATR